MQILRHLGLAARFASGYLIQLKPDVKSLDGPSGATQDFTDLHAWCEVYLPGAGWVGLDPTSGLFAGEGHIPLACAANPTQAAPITGAVEKSEVLFDFDMSIERVLEPPRVTKPYSDEQWAEIEKLGDQVDQILNTHDVRLTMGGEPTFVSIDDRSGAEWHTAAVGPTKRGLADMLIRRLRDRFAPGGLLHYGQGKWYPGESLPRWAFALYWRADGVPLGRMPSASRRRKPITSPPPKMRAQLTEAIAGKLGLDPSYAMPAYEDFWHHLGKERSLPDNVDPLDSKLDDKEERARLARVFERGLAQPVGYVLPVERSLNGSWLFGTLENPLRPHSVDPRRFRHRLPPAAAFPAVCAAGSAQLRAAARSVRAAAAAGAARRLRPGLSQRPCNESPTASRQPEPSRRSRAAPKPCGAHRPDGRAARRPALHLHAADRQCRAIISPCWRRSKTPPRSWASSCISKAIRRPMIRASMSSR